jgi:streptomycin 6-kinase
MGMVAPAGRLPEGAVVRLTEHYGRDVLEWLNRAEGIVADAAARWKVQLAGFHDAGWTSVVGIGRDQRDRLVVLKALPETDRYQQERAALDHWADDGVCRLLDADDNDQILMIEAVGDAAGGEPRPEDHARRVAAALPRLHRTPVRSGGPVPMLTDYYLGAVIPRIERRATDHDLWVGTSHVQRAVSLGRDLCSWDGQAVMLHADLYAENVLFDRAGRAVFIDPHAKVGSPAFDWAFWCIYYMPTVGFAERVALCREQVPTVFDEVLAWAVTLAVDGALYYMETGDNTANSMLEVIGSPVLAGI